MNYRENSVVLKNVVLYGTQNPIGRLVWYAKAKGCRLLLREYGIGAQTSPSEPEAIPLQPGHISQSAGIVEEVNVHFFWRGCVQSAIAHVLLDLFG
ncbi:hypothetical protein TNCV_736561 [Trichonephila clavipes]|nr:hypothetical protein TNCV_736561 [Trichonephila clavipes]